MRRRAFLLAASGVGLSWLWRSSGFWPALGPPPTAIERLTGLLEHPKSAAVVGRAYLQAFPAESSPGLLAARLVERIPGGLETVAASTESRVSELVRRSIGDDFVDLDIVVLQGWVFARTEARLCALTELHELSASPA